MKFGKIKQEIINILTENYRTDQFNSIFREFYKILKENKIFKNYFLLYSNVENKKFKDLLSSKEYLDESLGILKSQKNNLVSELLKINLFVDKYSTNKTFIANEVYNKLDILLSDNIMSNMVEERIDAKKYLISNLLREEITINNPTRVPIKFYTDLLTKKFNEKYSSMNEEEKRIFKVLTSKDVKKEKELFDDLLKENKDKTNDLLMVGSLDENVREKLESILKKMEIITNNKEEIIKLIQLKENLGKIKQNDFN